MSIPNYTLRPKFHFTPATNWMNDPNGLVYENGRWHLFYQYNPLDSYWGNMSWGHASSSDLQNWDENPVAIRFREGEQIFSGSAVAVEHNGTEALMAFYTSAFDIGHQAQSRALSYDSGLTWQEDPNNPILDRGTPAFRDPKIIRYQDPAGATSWVMVVVEAEDRQVLFYRSTDLETWDYLSAYGPCGVDGVVWECPDLLYLPVAGSSEHRWVLTLSTNPVGENPAPIGSSMSYVVGDFDGTTFTADSTDPAGDSLLIPLDHGRDFYAGVTFDSAPGGAATMMGWMSNWRYAANVPTTPWRGSMSLPRNLHLRRIDGELRLVQELPQFVSDHLDNSPSQSLRDLDKSYEFSVPQHAVLRFTWEPRATGALNLLLGEKGSAYLEITHAPTTQQITVTRGGKDAEALHPDFPSTATMTCLEPGQANLDIAIDGSLVEVFAEHGLTTASNLVFFSGEITPAVLRTEQPGEVQFTLCQK